MPTTAKTRTATRPILRPSSDLRRDGTLPLLGVLALLLVLTGAFAGPAIAAPTEPAASDDGLLHAPAPTAPTASDASQDDEAEEEEPKEIDEEDPSDVALTAAINAFRKWPSTTGTRERRESAVSDHALESEERFQAVIDEFPGTTAEGEAHFWRSECQVLVEDWASAQEGYAIALARVGEGLRAGEIRYGLGRTYIELDDPERALPFLEEVRAGYTNFLDYPAALYELGRALRELARYDEARVVWNDLMSGYGASAAAKKARGRADSLRPPRECLAEWIPEFDSRKKEYELADRKGKPAALKEVGDLLEKIGELEAPEAEQFLLGLVRREVGDLRAAAVGPLLEAGGPRSAEVLIGQRDEFDEPTLRALLEGLGPRHLSRTKLRVFAPYLASGGAPRVQEAAVDLYGRVGSQEAVRALVGAIPEADSLEGLGAAQLKLVGRIGRSLRRLRDPEGIETLGKIVERGRNSVIQREIVAESLGYTRSRAAVEPLRAGLFDRSSAVAAASARSLGRLEAEEAADDLAKLLVDRRRDLEFLREAVQALGRIDPTPAEDALLGLSNTKDVGLRTLVIGALGKIRTEASLERLVQAFEDPAWQVRSAALGVAAELRKVEVIEGLVAMLERESGALRPKIAEALITHLGVDKGADPRLWREYWDFARANFDESAVSEAEEGKSTGRTFVRKADPKAARRASYFGVEIVSKRLAFIIDVSGSMAAEVTVPNDDGGTSTMRRVDLARDELLRAVGLLEKGTYFNLVKFDQTPVPLWKKLRKLSKKSVTNARKFAEGLQPAGGTNIYDSLAGVLEAGDVDTIYLLSDGAPSAGTYTDPARILEEIARLNEASQVTIHTISLGFDSAFMRQLAEQNRGNSIVAGR